MANYIRFDWAMKRLLRDKANFSVLEGLLTTLLNEKITIRRLLESESNQESEFDKYNRVDILAEDSKGTLILFEIQNNNEYAYFQRMLFGVSKLVTEYINRGEGYENIRKIYSVNIVYFALGSGSDTVYHGQTEFRGHPYQRTALPLPFPAGDLQGDDSQPAVSRILYPSGQRLQQMVESAAGTMDIFPQHRRNPGCRLRSRPSGGSRTPPARPPQ